MQVQEQPAHIEVEYVRGGVIYKGVKITLKNWVEREDLRYKNKFVKLVDTEFGFPQELAGPCLIILGYISGPCIPWGLAEPIQSYDERKELSDLIKKNSSSKVLFHVACKIRPKAYQLNFDF